MIFSSFLLSLSFYSNFKTGQSSLICIAYHIHSMYRLIVDLASCSLSLAWQTCSYSCPCTLKILITSSQFEHISFSSMHLSIFLKSSLRAMMFFFSPSFSSFNLPSSSSCSLFMKQSGHVHHSEVSWFRNSNNLWLHDLFKLFRILMLSYSLSKVFPRASR